MNLKKIRKWLVLISILFIIFCLFNFHNIVWYSNAFIWKYYFNKWDYPTSLNLYTQAYKHNESIENKYNLANTYYKLWLFDNALNLFEQTDKYTNTGFNSFHNKWNTYYKIWKKTSNIQNLHKSLGEYKKALDINEDIQTRENYEFVKSLLEEKTQEDNQKQKNKEEQKNKKEQEKKEGKNTKKQKEDNNNEDKEEKSDWNKDNNNEWDSNIGKNWKNEEIIKQERWDDYILDKNNIWELSEQNLKEIEKHLEYLKNEERVNQRYFNKKDDNNFNNFFNIPWFWNNSVDKDW